jgi:hypothetical protein
VKPWDPLNARQLDTLRRIADGPSVDSSTHPGFSGSVYALRARGLVTTPRQGRGWRAEITDAGRFYLEHGYHPRRPVRALRPQREKDSSGAAQIAIAPGDLVGMIQTAGGSLTISDPAPEVRAAWRRAIHAARTSREHQAAMLMYTGRDRGDLKIWLPSHTPPATAPTPVATPPVQPPKIPGVTVAGRLPAAPHPVVALVQDNPALVHVTRGLLPRVLVILQAIAGELRDRGYDLIVATRRGRHCPVIDANGFLCELIIKEKCEYPRGTPPAAPGSWERRPSTVPTGRLQLSLGRHGRTWTDGKRSKLENRLGEVLAELDHRAAVYQARRARREREQAERRQQRDKEVAAARDAFTYAYRRDHLLAQHNAWRLADSLRQFCTAMDKAYIASEPAPWQHAGRQWTTWLMHYADSIDPALWPETLASIPFDPEPAPEDLGRVQGRGV